MRCVWIIARTSILENSRKHVFHVLCLILLTVICGSTLLSVLTEGVKIKIIKDLCMTSILFGGAVLSIALGSGGIPNDLESRTLYPVLARPVARFHYVLGKYLGTLLTVSLGVIGMAAVFLVLIVSYERAVDPYLLLAVGYTLLQTALIAALATAISTFASPALTAVVTFLLYILGTIKMGYLGGMIDSLPNGVLKFVSSVAYHILPNLECFNFKSALVHHDPVPTAYLIQVAAYGLLYTVLALSVASAAFSRKEV